MKLIFKINSRPESTSWSGFRYMSDSWNNSKDNECWITGFFNSTSWRNNWDCSMFNFR